MCSASQPSSRAITEAIRSAKHFLPRSALPPYPDPYDQISRVSGKWTIHFSSLLHGHAHVGLARLERRADRVHARHELAVVAEHLERGGAGPGHRPHAHGDVGRVGDLDADVRQRRAERAHAEGHDVHRPAPHRAREQLVEPGPHLRRVLPVVGRPGVGFALGADEGAVLDAGDVARDRMPPSTSPGAWPDRARRTCPRRRAACSAARTPRPSPSNQWTESGSQRATISFTQPSELLVPGGWGVQRDGHDADSLRGNGPNSLPAAARDGRTAARCTREAARTTGTRVG